MRRLRPDVPLCVFLVLAMACGSGAGDFHSGDSSLAALDPAFSGGERAQALAVSAQSTCIVDRLTDTGEGAGLSGDLRYCIIHANSGLDTITFGVKGTVNLTRALPDLATSVTIAGPGAGQLTVRGSLGFVGPEYSIFKVTGVPTTVVISGLTIAFGGGYIFGGGGIYVAEGAVFINDATLSNNRAGAGGGIYLAGGAVSVNNTTLDNNSVPGSSGPGLGGGIYVANGNRTITDSILSNNSVTGDILFGGDPGLGGGMYVAGGTVSVRNTTLSNNGAFGTKGYDEYDCFFVCYGGGTGGLGLGGGIYVAGGTVSVTNSTMSSNQAVGGKGGFGFYGGTGGTGAGGGIHVAGGTVRVFQSTLSANQSTGGDGGDWDGDGGNALGGGLSISGGTVEVQHSTLSTNQSTGGGASSFYGLAGQGRGGGLAFTAGTLRTRNTILAGNTAQTTAPDLSGSLGSAGHNLIGNSTGGSGFDPTDLLNADPRLGPLQDNGGPTLTRAPLVGSPAIDAGDNANAPEFDQRGSGFPRIVNGIIDIGAFEVQ